MGILQTTKGRIFCAIFVVLVIFAFWPGPLGPSIGYNIYEPLFFGWLPGWLFFRYCIYYIIWIVTLIFAWVVVMPLVKHKKEGD
jgi:hypothetical protein